LNDSEFRLFQRNVGKTGLSQEAYLRKLIMEIQPKEVPPFEYNQLIQTLLRIGSNMNQIAVKLQSTGIFEADKYFLNYSELLSVLLQIHKMFE